MRAFSSKLYYNWQLQPANRGSSRLSGYCWGQCLTVCACNSQLPGRHFFRPLALPTRPGHHASGSTVITPARDTNMPCDRNVLFAHIRHLAKSTSYEHLAFLYSCPADVPKALVAAVVLRDQARPEWPDSSSMINLVVSAAAAAAGATAHEGMPPMAYRELAAACWAHEARDR